MLCNEFQTRLVYIIKSQPEEEEKTTIYYLLCSGFISPLVEAKEFRITYQVLFQSSTVISLQKKSSLHLLLLCSLICCDFLLPYRALALSFLMLISELVHDPLNGGINSCALPFQMYLSELDDCSHVIVQLPFLNKEIFYLLEFPRTIYHLLTLVCCIY